MAIMDVFCWFVDQSSLATYLCSDFIVGQTSSGEYWNLLPSGDRVHRIYGGDTCGDHFFRVNLARLSSTAVELRN